MTALPSAMATCMARGRLGPENPGGWDMMDRQAQLQVHGLHHVPPPGPWDVGSRALVGSSRHEQLWPEQHGPGSGTAAGAGPRTGPWPWRPGPRRSAAAGIMRARRVTSSGDGQIGVGLEGEGQQQVVAPPGRAAAPGSGGSRQASRRRRWGREGRSGAGPGNGWPRPRAPPGRFTSRSRVGLARPGRTLEAGPWAPWDTSRSRPVEDPGAGP